MLLAGAFRDDLLLCCVVRCSARLHVSSRASAGCAGPGSWTAPQRSPCRSSRGRPTAWEQPRGSAETRCASEGKRGSVRQNREGDGREEDCGWSTGRLTSRPHKTPHVSMPLAVLLAASRRKRCVRSWGSTTRLSPSTLGAAHIKQAAGWTSVTLPTGGIWLNWFLFKDRRGRPQQLLESHKPIVNIR